MRLLHADEADQADAALEEVLLLPELLRCQREKVTHEHFVFLRDRHEPALRAFAHEVARAAVDTDGLAQIAEQRSVVVVFCTIKGLEAALGEGGQAALTAVQEALHVSLPCIRANGGSLRQYMLDDKGMVLIWTLGLQQHKYSAWLADSSSRGLKACLAVAEALQAVGLHAQMGITSGMAFCGLVGTSYRHEYTVMGPAVNLAARLMCMCETHRVGLLCNDDIFEQVRDARASPGRPIFTFTPFPPQRVKGYSEPVGIYAVVLDEKKTLAHETLSSMDVEWFQCLAPVEQSALLDVLAVERFTAGDQIIAEGEEVSDTSGHSLRGVRSAAPELHVR